MKKFLFLLMAGTFLCNPAVAKHCCSCDECSSAPEYQMAKPAGGFVDTEMKPMSVAEVRKLSDDAYVTMAGHIVKRLSSDEYDFTDGTGNVVVKIKGKVWKGLTVTPKDEIIIVGEADKDLTSFKVDAKSISLAK